MGSEIVLWELLVAMVYSTKEGLRERSKTCLCTADSLIEAVFNAQRYGQWLKENWKAFEGEEGAFVGCIKVYPKTIGAIRDNGAPHEVLGFNNFEWKYDWPGSFEEYVRMKQEDLARANSSECLDREACIEALLNRVDDWDLGMLLEHARSSMEDDLRSMSNEWLFHEYKDCYDKEPPTSSPCQTDSSKGSGKEATDANA